MTAVASATAAVSEAAMWTTSTIDRRSGKIDNESPADPGPDQGGGRQPTGGCEVETDDECRFAPGDADGAGGDPEAEPGQLGERHHTGHDGQSGERVDGVQRVVRRQVAGTARPTPAAARAAASTAAVRTSIRRGVPEMPTRAAIRGAAGRPDVTGRLRPPSTDAAPFRAAHRVGRRV